MKAIRRSIKGDRNNHEPPRASIQPKSALAITPPKKVIKALYDYTANPNESHQLSFHRGDFFHVISRENDEDWYEAANPVNGQRGLVPVTYFEVFGQTQTERQSSSSQRSIGSPIPIDSGYSTAGSIHTRSASSNTGAMSNGTRQSASVMMKGGGGGKASPMVYGIVQYDFTAERPDELDAKAGEAIIVIAQSNPEWFVAKPIGRLGGPGLIPVSFIEIKDMATGEAVKDPHEAVQKAGVPKVEEWKKLAAAYKDGSIHLGQITAGSGVVGGFERMSISNGQPNNGMPHGGRPGTNGGQQSLLAPVSASVPRYCFDNDKYWFIIECVLEDGSHWELSRYYQNFYDFQIKLLQAFPTEAGNGENGGQRILPYMPGPVTYVTEHISNMRRESLDDYVKRLLNLPPYISRSDIVKELFAPRDGDFELDPQAVAEYRLSQGSRGSNRAPGSQGNGQANGAVQQQARQDSPGTLDSRNSGQQPVINTPASSNTALENTNQTRAADTAGATTGGAMTIKCWWGEDLVKVRMPADVSFVALKEKLQERFKAREEIRIQWQDPTTDDSHELLSDHDLDWVISRTQGKLILGADYA